MFKLRIRAAVVQNPIAGKTSAGDFLEEILYIAAAQRASAIEGAGSEFC